MMATHLFKEYEKLTAKADLAFVEMRNKYPSCVKCAPGCSDCCHAVFGLFLIEAAYLRACFEKLERRQRGQAIARADRAEKEMELLMRRMQMGKGDALDGSFALEKARLRCPLLDETNECVLYAYRPVTCRVYGIPTAIHGKAHVCWKAEFEKGASYPAFNLDDMNKALHRLSREFLQAVGGPDLSKASLLVSVSRVITTRTTDLIRGIFL